MLPLYIWLESRLLTSHLDLIGRNIQVLADIQLTTQVGLLTVFRFVFNRFELLENE